MSSPAPSPQYWRHANRETVMAGNYPVFTDDEPYWQDLPRAEVIADPSPKNGKALRHLAGVMHDEFTDADVLEAASAKLGGDEFPIGSIVGINYSSVTRCLSLERFGTTPQFDARHISQVRLTMDMFLDLTAARDLEELADLIERNAALIGVRLRDLSRHVGLADLTVGDAPVLTLSSRWWPDPDIPVETR